MNFFFIIPNIFKKITVFSLFSPYVPNTLNIWRLWKYWFLSWFVTLFDIVLVRVPTKQLKWKIFLRLWFKKISTSISLSRCPGLKGHFCHERLFKSPYMFYFAAPSATAYSHHLHRLTPLTVTATFQPAGREKEKMWRSST